LFALTGFRGRRTLNWLSIGFLYASYYMCRYNFRFAVPGLQTEFNFDVQDVSFIFAIWSVAYGTGQLINGLLTDQMGGKKGLIFGALLTVIINFIFGFSSLVSQFGVFALLALLNGYFQSFGAPGMIKINSAWFHRKERGLFSGVLGGVIQLGQMGISQLAPALLNSGLIIGGIYFLQKGDWRSVFIIPPFFTIIATFFAIIFIKESPEKAGYPHMIEDEIDNSMGERVSIKESFKKITQHPFVWYYAFAYACTGGVRHSLDQLSILYFRDQLGFDMENNIPWIASFTLIIMPFVAFLGSLTSGILSDRYFKGERGFLSACLYFGESLSIAIAAILVLNDYVQATPTGVIIGCLILIVIAFTVNSTHSLVGSAAPMDIGGKKMSGFAAGLIDSFQYFGGALSFLITGQVLAITQSTSGYFYWYVIMAGFGLIGGTIMLLMERKRKKRLEPAV
jgi:MFS transporter, OPA family, glycerol-3-phosphate transporter